MKILFLGDEKNHVLRLVDAINAHTVHEALRWGKLKRDENAREILSCPMATPDVVMCIDNYVTWEDLNLMGITNKPKRCLYVTGGAVRRGGTAKYDWRFRDFNKYYFGQTELDKQYFYAEGVNPLTGALETSEAFLDLTFLPLYIDAAVDAVSLRQDKLVIGQAQSRVCHLGSYSKGFDWLMQLHEELDVDLNIIFGKPHADCLFEKAQCNLIFDNPYGNIGVSGLESLAQGLPVIGRFSPVVLENWQRLSGGDALPVIQVVDYADLKSKVQSYIADLSQLVAIGQAGQAWMNTYYTAQNIAGYWMDTIAAKLNGS